MVAPSNNSFIPKRGPAKRSQKTATRQVYIFTYISYILTFATLLAAGGLFIYERVVEQQLNDEIRALNTEIDSFNPAELQQVTEFDQRLQQASSRLDASISITSLFSALEAATVDSVKILDLNLERTYDENVQLTAAIETDSFDSTIFQRGVFTRNQTISEVELSNVIRDPEIQNANASGIIEVNPVVTFQANITVPLEQIPYRPIQSGANTPATPITISQPETINGEDVEGGIEEVNEPEI